MATKLTLPEMQDLRDLLFKYMCTQNPKDKLLIDSANFVDQHISVSIDEKLYGTEE
jgi:hypothetical protein